MGSEFEENIKNRGELGEEWFKKIPGIITACEEKWSVKALPPFDLTWNYVAPVIRSDGTSAVLKIGFPHDDEFRTEAAALKIFQGEGVEKLLAEDRENLVILIERVSPGIPLSNLDDDEEATKILTQVIKKIRKPLPPNHHFTTIKEWSRAIPELHEKYKNTSIPHLPRYLVEKADDLFSELIDTSGEQMLLHGDLHQDNVLSSDRDRWLGIDPKGIVAEPAYETAAMIRNPYKKMWQNRHMKEIMKNRIIIMATELGLEPERILKWCLAQTVLSAVWSLESENRRWEHALNVALALDELKL